MTGETGRAHADQELPRVVKSSLQAGAAERKVAWPSIMVASSWIAIGAAMAISRFLPAPRSDEVSIYAALPPAVWVLLGVALVGFASQVLMGSDSGRTIAWYSALAGLVLTSLTLQALPHLRGYEFFGRADSAAYQGTLLSLISSGRLLPEDFYPAATLVAAQLVVFAGVPPGLLDVAGRLLPLAVYVLGSVILARCILGTRKWDGFVVVASLVPMAGAYLANLEPPGFGVALTPLVMATLFPEVGATTFGRRARTLLLLTFAFVHPLGCLLLIGVSTVVYVVSRIVDGRGSKIEKQTPHAVSTGVTLLAVSFTAWITSSAIFHSGLAYVRDAILSGSKSPGQNALELADRARLDPVSFVLLPIQINVGVLLAAVVGLGACVLALTLQRRTWEGRRDRVAILMGVEMLLGFAFLASLVSPLGLDLFRFLHYFAIIAPVLLAMAAAVLGWRARTISAAFVIGVGLLSIPFTYLSPLVKAPTDFIPTAEMLGVRWLLDHNNDSSPLPMISLQGLGGQVDLAVGTERRRQVIGNPIPVPDHFGIEGDGVIHLGNVGPVVLTVSMNDVLAYTGVWSSADRINHDDLSLLSRDASVSRVYTNDAIDIYVVQPDHAIGPKSNQHDP